MTEGTFVLIWGLTKYRWHRTTGKLQLNPSVVTWQKYFWSLGNMLLTALHVVGAGLTCKLAGSINTRQPGDQRFQCFLLQSLLGLALLSRMGNLCFCPAQWEDLVEDFCCPSPRKPPPSVPWGRSCRSPQPGTGTVLFLLETPRARVWNWTVNEAQRNHPEHFFSLSTLCPSKFSVLRRETSSWVPNDTLTSFKVACTLSPPTGSALRVLPFR